MPKHAFSKCQTIQVRRVRDVFESEGLSHRRNLEDCMAFAHSFDGDDRWNIPVSKGSLQMRKLLRVQYIFHLTSRN